MFSITKIPVRTDTPLLVSVTGNVLTINGEQFDFTDMPTNSELPVGSIDSQYILSSVVCDDEGVIHLDILCPYGKSDSPIGKVAEVFLSGDVINGGT